MHQLRLVGRTVIALLVCLLLLELLLQLGARIVQGQSRQVAAQWLTGHTRILAVGDSNTYGLYLQQEEAWPAQLEQLWNTRHPSSPIEVLNLGYPGTNSFRVRDNLPALLDKLAPDIVLIMVGFNDFWTPVESSDAVADSTTMQRAVRWIKTHSRLFRLYTIVVRSRISQQDMQFGSPRDIRQLDLKNPDVHLLRMDGEAFYLGTRQGDPAKNRHALQDNLVAMVAMARRRDAKVYLMTYPSSWGFYPGANQWLRTVAETESVPLIDVSSLFVTACADGPKDCPDLLFHDGHATASGNAKVAAVVEQVLALKP
ncbi:MAG: hypothetical protein IT470_00895 [Pseudomonadales bacterium]|nr:hypothetical protein [Pseudomonadales bacterium]